MTEDGYPSDGAPGPRLVTDRTTTAPSSRPRGNSVEAVLVSRGGAPDPRPSLDRVADLDQSTCFYETIAPVVDLQVVRIPAGPTPDPERTLVAGDGAVASASVMEGEPTQRVHLAFAAADRATVAAFHRLGTSAGFVSLGEPAEPPHYHPGYYGAYLRAPTATTSKPCFTTRRSAACRRRLRRCWCMVEHTFDVPGRHPIRDEYVLEVARLVRDPELVGKLERAVDRDVSVLALTLEERHAIASHSASTRRRAGGPPHDAPAAAGVATRLRALADRRRADTIRAVSVRWAAQFGGCRCARGNERGGCRARPDAVPPRGGHLLLRLVRHAALEAHGSTGDRRVRAATGSRVGILRSRGPYSSADPALLRTHMRDNRSDRHRHGRRSGPGVDRVSVSARSRPPRAARDCEWRPTARRAAPLAVPRCARRPRPVGDGCPRPTPVPTTTRPPCRCRSLRSRACASAGAPGRRTSTGRGTGRTSTRFPVAARTRPVPSGAMRRPVAACRTRRSRRWPPAAARRPFGLARHPHARSHERSDNRQNRSRPPHGNRADRTPPGGDRLEPGGASPLQLLLERRAEVPEPGRRVLAE